MVLFCMAICIDVNQMLETGSCAAISVDHFTLSLPSSQDFPAWL